MTEEKKKKEAKPGAWEEVKKEKTGAEHEAKEEIKKVEPHKKEKSAAKPDAKESSKTAEKRAGDEEKAGKEKKKKEEKKEEKIILERIYTIPLRDARKSPRHERASRAVRITREFLKKHMKSPEVKLENDVVDYIWARGIQKVPSRVKVKAEKTETFVRAKLVKE